MKISTRLATAALTGALSVTLAAPLPAAADGAASTRNIIFGAAAIGGTLLIVNHNKKVHQKNAEYDQRQAQTQAEANQAQAAYESEKRAYANEVALVREYRSEVAYQHSAIRQRDARIASLTRSLIVAKANVRGARTTAFARAEPVHASPRVMAVARGHRVVASRRPAASRQSAPVQVVSYGWGSY